MAPGEIARAIAARPEADLRAAAAGAAYDAALAAQEAGAPSSVVAGLLVAFVDVVDALEAEVEAVTTQR